MNRFVVLLMLLNVVLCWHPMAFAQPEIAGQRPRVIVLTDIENEPDDAQSMVRFLLYVNHFDVEALIATTSIHQRSRTAPERIRRIVGAYGKVRDNLMQHEQGYPSEQELLATVTEGKAAYGMTAVGAGMDSPGSERILEIVDRDDPRPVWVTVWGGANCLAQALWKVRATRAPDDVDAFVAKLRVYTISDQDDSGPWLRREFPKLFYIVSPGFGYAGAYHHGTWSGISGDVFHGRFQGADFRLVDNPWLDEYIRAKGPLGAEYPHTEYLMEGDTPSFLNLINNGLSVPERPDWGGWGGRYEFYTPRQKKYHPGPEIRPFWTDAEDEVMGVDNFWHQSNKATIWRWRQAYQHDFAARMGWTIKPFAEANHPPVVRLGHADRLRTRSGAIVQLSAAGTTDPDDDAMHYQWLYYAEPGTLVLATGRTGAPLGIENAQTATASFIAPKVQKPETMHFILSVTDTGSPSLTRYRRVIVTVYPE